MIICSRRIQWCMGHRVVGHEGKCRMLHGHNYVAILDAEAPALDGIGRVIDFSVLKERIGGWVEEHWDHGFLLWDKDGAGHAGLVAFEDQPGGAHQKIATLPSNPTAENIANHLLCVVGSKVLKDTGVRLVRVEVWETENCRAVATL